MGMEGGPGRKDEFSIAIIGMGTVGTLLAERLIDRYSVHPAGDGRRFLDKIYAMGRYEHLPNRYQRLKHGCGVSNTEIIPVPIDKKKSIDGNRTTLDEVLEKSTCLIIAVENEDNGEIIKNVPKEELDIARRKRFSNNRGLMQGLGNMCRGYEGDVFILTNPVDENCYVFADASEMYVNNIHGISHMDLVRLRVIVEDILREDTTLLNNFGGKIPQEYLDSMEIFGPHSDKLEVLFSKTTVPGLLKDAGYEDRWLEQINKGLQNFYATYVNPLFGDQKPNFPDDSIRACMDVFDAFFLRKKDAVRQFLHLSSFLDLSQYSSLFVGIGDREERFLEESKGKGIFISYRAGFDLHMNKITYFPGEETDKKKLILPYMDVFEYLKEQKVLR